MARQNLEKEAIYSLLREWDGKLTGEEMLRRFVDLGHYTVDVWDAQKKMLNDDLRGFRSRCRRNGEIREQWLNFTEKGKDGEDIHYWKKFKRLSTDEHVQLWRRWAAKIDQDGAIFYEYFDATPKPKRERALEDFGVDNLPPRPRQRRLLSDEDDEPAEE